MLGFSSFLLVIFATHWFLKRKPIVRLEGIAHDLRFDLRSDRPPNPRIAIVGITSSSLDQTLLRSLAPRSETIRMMSDNVWPWPRAIHAKVIEKLFDAGAAVVAVDIGFPSERPGDEEFAEVLKKYSGRIVLANIVQNPQSETGGGVTFLPPHPRLAAAAGPNSSGLVVYRLDIDGVLRRFDFRSSELREMGYDDDTQDLPHFATRAVEIFDGVRLPSRYNEIIAYSGKPPAYNYIPVESIFDDALFNGPDPRFEKGNVLRGKLVFYGPIAEVLHDVHNTPFRMMPGVEIHAQVAASMLERRYISGAPASASALLGFTSTLGCALLVLRLRNPGVQTLALAALLATVFGVTQLVFSHGAVLFPTVPWFLGGLGAGAFGIVYLFFLEQWEKAHTRMVLNRFVSKRIATVILKNAEEFEIARRGDKRPVTVVFSDIRNFTTWSENAPAENVVDQLNEYFEKMVPLIEDTEGNAQKFIGDAILAVWGDTHSNGIAEDAGRALTSAMMMRPALKDLNALWANRSDRMNISIGIGVNHGDVVVGEVGHPERREFTVLGDGVNFAARLESATKQFHTDCLVGEGVEALTRDRFIFRQVGNLRVKGKTKPVRIFTPLSDVQIPAPEWLADYHRAIALHDTRQFPDAIALFRDVKHRTGSDDFLCDWYIEKCEALIASPPPAEWDASHALTEK